MFFPHIHIFREDIALKVTAGQSWPNYIGLEKENPKMSNHPGDYISPSPLRSRGLESPILGNTTPSPLMMYTYIQDCPYSPLFSGCLMDGCLKMHVQQSLLGIIILQFPCIN